MGDLSRSPLRYDDRCFRHEELAFAMAWEVYAPGLNGWTVHHEQDDDGTDLMLVDPPLVFGDGFTVRRDAAGVVISWSHGTLRAPSLRDALLLICPLCPDRLEAADRLAALPEP